MSDWDSIMMDALHDEERVLQDNLAIEDFDTSTAKRLKQKAKINLQPPAIQKYWLGRLAYELAIRNDGVKQVYSKSEKISNTKDNYDFQNPYSPQERYLILELNKYGFTSQPEKDILKTEHTSFPIYLIHHEYGKIEINTRHKIKKLLSILDGSTAKKLNMNTNDHKKWLNIGKVYTNSYLQLISLDYELSLNGSDYEGVKTDISSSQEWTL